MKPICRHPGHDPFAGAPGGTPTSRLNLLLSDASTHPHVQSDDTWAARLPRLLEPMGIRAHHATTGRQASDLMASTTIHVAVVDLGLPLDPAPTESAPAASRPSPEAGWRLLEILARLAHRPPTVAIKSAKTTRDEARELNAALRLGAFAVVDRPRTARDLETLLEVLRRCVTRHYKDQWPA
ncbi:MAG: response regulator [Planctomycetota bacterium]